MRCLTVIMMFNLYPIKKLTTINNARAIFLMELKEKTFIDISSHIFDTIMDETRTTSRPKLIFSSLLIRILRKKRPLIVIPAIPDQSRRRPLVAITINLDRSRRSPLIDIIIPD